MSDSVEHFANIAKAANAVPAVPMRVVVYGMNYAPEIAGVGKYTGEIATHLASEGVDVTVVTTPPHYPGWRVQPGHKNQYSNTVEDRVHVIRTPLLLRENMKGIWRLLAPISFAISSAPVIFWQIMRHRPDAVFCVEPTLFAAPVAQFAAYLVGARTVLHVQDLEVDAAFAVGHLGSHSWLRRLGFSFEKFCLRGFGNIVTISNRMSARLIEKGVSRETVSVVRNWVDLAHIYPLKKDSAYRNEFGFAETDFVLLYSGNIGAKQGLDILLDAAELLKEEQSLHFVIAGEGPSKRNLRERYGHLHNVRFVPFQPYSQLNEFLNMPDLHVLPQDKGAADLVLPSKLSGMLASGRKIIITAESGTELAEFVGDVAEIVSPGDPQLLAERIKAAADSRGSHDNRGQLKLSETLASARGLASIKCIVEAGAHARESDQ